MDSMDTRVSVLEVRQDQYGSEATDLKEFVRGEFARLSDKIDNLTERMTTRVDTLSSELSAVKVEQSRMSVKVKLFWIGAGAILVSLLGLAFR